MEDNKNQEVETLAWEMFQNKSGLRFRRTLTAEEKQELTTKIPEFQHYRDEALKLYNKRQAKQENPDIIGKYPIIKVEASGVPDWYKGARTWCFVYSKNHGNFILEGYRGEVEEYLQKNYTHYFCFWSMWHMGQSRGHWDFWKDNIGIFEPSRSRKDWKYLVRPYSSYGEHTNTPEEIKEKTLTFKRLPKRWIPEFDKL